MNGGGYTTADENNNASMNDRQPTPINATPASSTTDSPMAGSTKSPDDNNDETAGSQLLSDLEKVGQAVAAAGGLRSSRAPDLNNIQQRDGQVINVIAQEFDFSAEDDEYVRERPEEDTLRRVTDDELLPPPSDQIIPIDADLDLDADDFVREQRHELLVSQQITGNKQAPWGFPNKAMLQKIWDHIRSENDHAQIMDVALWSRVDKEGLASVMLSTVNYPLFKFSGNPGFRYETYSKRKWVTKYGISLYIPSENACYPLKRIFRSLMYKYPDLKCSFRVLTETIFTSDHPNKPADKRSRINDKILLLDGDELANKLKPYPEDFRFELSRGFNVTLRGGVRGNDTGPTFERSFAAALS